MKVRMVLKEGMHYKISNAHQTESNIQVRYISVFILSCQGAQTLAQWDPLSQVVISLFLN